MLKLESELRKGSKSSLYYSHNFSVTLKRFENKLWRRKPGLWRRLVASSGSAPSLSETFKLPASGSGSRRPSAQPPRRSAPPAHGVSGCAGLILLS